MTHLQAVRHDAQLDVELSQVCFLLLDKVDEAVGDGVDVIRDVLARGYQNLLFFHNFFLTHFPVLAVH